MGGTGWQRAQGFRAAPVIMLDTNFLIVGLVFGSAQDSRLRQWLNAGEVVRINVIVWAEFLCGPATKNQIQLALQRVPNPELLLQEDAVRGAELFNATGRRRGSLADCLIAATRLRLGSAIATENLLDFRPFEPMGLRIVSV
jgi:predicted nucleic acid-binding protein